ncbi:hypothetical protein M2459_002362 [Parabacteroides sp. PF5-5]|uniref:TonB-dependent receptor n=1 Tax=unclassified Parabacteroides TaxID=2649774 RepID=UPI002474B045|nr:MULTISPECIES: TonB-dependent receptor [unclassified Parabacteroides]MDH6305262.1 hypothetical protein [Parabacteroides sp. PH5-39]MDH6316615.1 hypothetical protein [Parabacteroides sp. PF5-13]MDH6320205.1 hypothetical protein [Parabacteroides sp. PH5-13]MDH6323852.1 hypothetical protein [Parabacteroides sp. PH5-8]MDH6327882.1 hypothetical protein [Parabacteroides sp. PH5-41]
MKTIYNIKAFSLLVLLTLSASVASQENNVSREMTLEREYDPSVQDANKVNTLPAVKEPVISKIPIDYSTFTIAGEPQRELDILPSGSVMTDMKYNNRRGYLNLGVGTYLNVNADAGYHILSTDKDQLNIFFSHRSTSGNLKYVQDSWDSVKVKAKLNDNLGGINFRHQFDRAALKLGAKYGYSSYNYYGVPGPTPQTYAVFPSSEYPLLDETSQVNQLIKINGGVESDEDAAVGYVVDLDYTNFSYKYGLSEDRDGITEHSIGGKLGLSGGFGGNQRIGIGAKFNYFNYSLPYDNPVFENYFEGTLNPYYTVEGDSWKVKLGVKAMLITGDSSKFFVSPDIAAEVLVGTKTVLYLVADGDIGSNSAYQLSRENRYINPENRVMASRTWLDAKVGLKSGVAPGFWFNLFGGYKITDKDYFFIPNFPPQGFANVSDALSLNSKRLQGGLEMKYAYQNTFEIMLKGVYNNWDIEEKKNAPVEYKAYGRPEMEFTAGIMVRPIDDLSLNLDYYLATGRETYVSGLKNEKLKNINELNFTGSYNFNDTFGAYVKLNNLLFQKYEKLYGYPLQGFNVMVGINLNF